MVDDLSGYDVLNYNLELRFDTSWGNILVNGLVDILLTPTVAELTDVDLDFHGYLMIDSVTVNGEIADYDHIWIDDLIVYLPQTLTLDDTVEISIAYFGQPPGFPTVEDGLYFYDLGIYPETLFSHSQPEGARNWWPCKDIPSDKATARMVWTVAEDFTATGNGNLVSVTSPEPGWTSYEWVENYPIAPYLISVTASGYAFWQDWYVNAVNDSLPLCHYIYPQDSLNSTIEFADLPDVMAFFASIFGEYPFMDEKYGHAENLLGGAMEHQTLTSYGAPLITGTLEYHPIVVHEVAHMWWGDMVTCATWADTWLNEGFATYCDALWIEYDEGWEAFLDRMDIFKVIYFEEELLTGRFPIYDPDPQFWFSGTIYEKGAWITHMVRYVLGEEDFGAFWLEWRSTYEYDAAETADLQLTLEDVSGMDISWFFDEWIYGAGYPEYAWGWQGEQINEDSSRVDVYIEQTQPDTAQTPLVFTMPVEMGVTTTLGYSTETVWNDQRMQNFSFNVPGVVTGVEFDPDVWILKTAEETGYVLAVEPDPNVPATHELALNVHPNPANPSALIRIELPQAQQAELAVYNLMGQKVTTLLNGWQPAGQTDISWDASRQASGIYLVRLNTTGEQITTKMMVVK
jgi:aminopeptidase N